LHKKSRNSRKSKKEPKMSKIVLIIAARWFSSCYDESDLLAKEITEENLKKIFHRSTIAHDAVSWRPR
jgi:hypothetical protein